MRKKIPTPPTTTPRAQILEAISATDSQSPFVSPTQLADALTCLYSLITSSIERTPVKEWLKKEEIKRIYNISDYTCKNIITRYNVQFQTTVSGKKLYSASSFRNAFQHATI